MMQHQHPLDSHHNHHHHTNGTATMQIPSSSSSLPESTTRTTMVTLVSPTLLTNGITAKKPPVLSMEVHYLPDPYNNVSSSSGNNKNSNNITSSQLRPYFLLRRERRLPQQQQPPPTPPNCGGDHASGTADNDYRYQLCEMTLMVNHMVNNNNSSSNNNNNNSYQSFLIANHNPGDSPSYVVQDGSLYALTPLDPLFWLLRDSYLPTTMAKSHTTNEAPKLQWQPLWQFLQEYDPVVQQCVGATVPPRQYRHLLNEMSMGDDDEDDSTVLVQFSVEKALRWLHLKQQTVEQYLLQSTTSTSPSPTNHASQPKGGFSSGFTIAKENNHGATTVPNTTTTTATITAQLDAESKGPPERHNNNNNDDENEETQAEWRRWMMIKEESIQLVSNYLSSAWQAQWLHYLNQQQHDPEYARWIQQQQVAETTTTPRCSSAMNNNDDTTTTTTRTTQPTVDWNMSLTTTTTMGSSTESSSLHVSKPPPMTAGAKRLLKPSSQQQRGLQSVASFFQSKKLTKK